VLSLPFLYLPSIYQVVPSSIREHAEKQPDQAREAEHDRSEHEADKGILSVQLERPRRSGSSGIKPAFECVDTQIGIRKALV
jgi:hypothetical protein